MGASRAPESHPRAGARQQERLVEEAAEIPYPHAEALVEVASGTVAFDRLPVATAGAALAHLDRFILPHGLDVLTVVLKDGADVPTWFGPEVTGLPEFENGVIAREGLPPLDLLEVTAEGLEALLDALEGKRSPHAKETLEPTHGQAPLAEAPPQLLPLSPSDQPVGYDLPLTADREHSPAADEEHPPKRQDFSRATLQIDQEVASGLAKVTTSDQVMPQTRQSRKERRELTLRSETGEPDEGLARLARALAPRGLPLR